MPKYEGTSAHEKVEELISVHVIDSRAFASLYVDRMRLIDRWTLRITQTTLRYNVQSSLEERSGFFSRERPF